ncbi:MAG TPA: hypothetical protein VK878_20090 [Candidatus Deferrimicrobiaceae bacterium]|nr:hypothetical protein [Candidatus Deferrimicrobiaceae bacterium]
METDARPRDPALRSLINQETTWGRRDPSPTCSTRQIPIYVARHGTKLEFDLKDYPVIFFKGMKELKDALEKRLRGLAEARKRGPDRPRALADRARAHQADREKVTFAVGEGKVTVTRDRL